MKFGDFYSKAALSIDFTLVSAGSQEVIIESTKNESPQRVEDFFDRAVVFFSLDNNKIVVEVDN